MSAKCCLEYNRDVCFVTGNGLQYVIIFLNENDDEIDISGYDSFDYYLMQIRNHSARVSESIPFSK